MSDAGPDYRYEAMRLEAQAKGIRITVLDQKVQLLDFETERERLGAEKDDRVGELPEVLTKGDEVEQLRSLLNRERAELTIFNIDMRMAELDGIESRHRENIAASDLALAELDEKIRSLKEAESIG